MLKTLRRRGADQSGVTLVLVAIMMVVFLGMGALAVDVGSFYKAQRQAQAAADAGALAASQDLPNTTSATTDGSTYASTNYPGATVTVTAPCAGSTSKVKVTVNATTPAILGTLFGLSSAKVSASAVAGATFTGTSCTTAGTSCYAIFAMDSSCTTAPVNLGGGSTLNGGVHALHVGTDAGGTDHHLADRLLV